ncbi:MAG: HEAT repeat domain-containing protein [Aggregatilineales bacterium]
MIEAHLNAFGSDDETIAMTAVAELAASDDEIVVQDTLLNVLRDDTTYNLQQQGYAIAAFNRMRVRQSQPEVIGAIAGAFFRTLQAVKLNGDFEDPAATIMLTEMMNIVNDSQSGVFNTAMLHGVAHPHPEVRKWALLLLHIDAGTTPQIIAAFADENISMDVKRYLMSRLVTLDFQIIDTAINALQHEHPQVRYWMARALSHLHDPGVVPALIPLLDDDDGEVVQQAAITLQKINNAEARAVLDAWRNEV